MAAGQTSTAESWKPSHNPWLVAMSVMLATFMEVLDTSVANVSLPHIAGNLSATTDESTWVLTSYLVANAIILPATNWLGSLFGRKRFLTICIGLFTLASALCGAAPTLGFLVFARILQGAAGGALQPISQAVLMESFPPEKRGRATAVFAMGVVVAPVIGPTLGGWITDNFSWRWIFYINLPVGVLAVFMVRAFIEDPPYLVRATLHSFDGIGFALMSLWLGTMQYVLDKAQMDDWFESPLICWLVAISTTAFAAFIAWELKIAKPIVDLRILKNRNFAVGVGLMTLLGAVLYATTAVMPLLMQTLLSYTALQARLAMSPRGVAAFVTTLVVGRLIGKVSSRFLIALGFTLLAISSGMLGHVSLEIAQSDIVWPAIINGIAISFIFVPLTTSTMGTLQRQQLGNASGIYNLLRNLGGSVGIAGITTLLARGSQANQARLVSHFTATDLPYMQRLSAFQAAFFQKHGDPVLAARQAQAALSGILEQQASALAYMQNFRLFAIVCLCCIPLIMFLKKVAPPKGPVAAH
jgi:MFS transporter, DHA2 family, multidrug resistance protein